MTSHKLSRHQLVMLRCSGFDHKDGNGFGVHLMTASSWRTARSLVARDLGWIQGGHPNGSDLPGLFFANHNGTAITHPEQLAAFERRRGAL